MHNGQIPQHYFVTSGTASWTARINGRLVWFYAPVKTDGVPDWANYGEIERNLIDEPLDLFYDEVTDPWAKIEHSARVMDTKMSLFDLVHAVNDAVGMPVAKVAHIGVTYGVRFELGGFTFDVAQDLAEGHTTQIVCHARQSDLDDRNKKDARTGIQLFDEAMAVDDYQGWGNEAWANSDFESFVKDRVTAVLRTDSFAYVHGEPTTRDAHTFWQ